ncbi:uncharacterized protein LOC130674016 isoform X3 [Microplitis mediator]|uniref:uncharacterized protein LOC130674016 isoform X3 n=1 Tax=Microplitis mediator TaxID=375433 RepID=UPI0025564FBB|nr:uncharacterized protein LOC130674016 isoform X3 [Microplitis mediator]
MNSQIIRLALLLISGASVISSYGCGKEDHQKCVTLADPLLKDPHLIFPDNMQDIDLVCRSWAGFVDCIKQYIDRCFSKQRRDQFNAAVEAPISSVHQMCSVSTYQAEYLQHASCLKATVTEPQHCGNEYSALVDEVSRGEMARANLCCLHHQFRSCVITETRKRCDRGDPSGPASRFSRQILDRALSFLQEQCQNYIPNNRDCVNSVTENSIPLSVSSIEESSSRGTNRRPYHRTLSPESYSGQASSFHGASTSAMNGPSSYRSTGRSLNVLPMIYHFVENEEFDSRPAPTIVASETQRQSTTEAPSSSPEVATPKSTTDSPTEAEVKTTEEKKETSTITHSIEEPAVVVTQRSQNYGRGISWTTPSPKVTTEIPAWATSSWQEAATESWYPDAGSFGGNNIDEPNQQGLRNGQSRLRMNLCLTVILIFAVYSI